MTLLRQFCLILTLHIAVVSAGLAAAETAGTPKAVRVLSQTVGTDEMLLALAEPGQIAGLSYLAVDSRYCADAALAGRFPRLEQNGDAETALKLRPTLLLCADYSRVELVNQLRRAGVRVIVFNQYKTLEDSYENLRIVARELGCEGKAERIIADCRARVEKLRTQLSGVKPVRVVAPSIYGVIPGAETTFQELCNYSGAENLASTLGGLRGHVPPPSESMLTWPVDRVVVAGTDVETALKPFRTIPPYQFMKAVQEGRAALVPTFILSCVTFRRVEAYEIMARVMHPEVFAKGAQD